MHPLQQSGTPEMRINSTKRLKSYDAQRWICYRCHLKELQFFNKQNLSYLRIAHLNKQSMSSTFDELQVMLYQHPFDIITLSETWLRNDTNLLQYVQIPGYSFCYKNRDEEVVSECT